MRFLTVKDGTTFSTRTGGDAEMLFSGEQGSRLVAHDRRSHGAPGEPGTATRLLEAIDLKNAGLVGHSTGGGEGARCSGRHGSSRVAKSVLIRAVPSILVKSATNLVGTPIEAVNAIRRGYLRG